jgi:hypothetical protein
MITPLCREFNEDLEFPSIIFLFNRTTCVDSQYRPKLPLVYNVIKSVSNGTYYYLVLVVSMALIW